MLHLCYLSPSRTDVLERNVPLLSHTDAVLLLQNGVFAAIKRPHLEQIWQQTQGTKLYVLRADFYDRNLNDDDLNPSFHITDYAGFVTLVTEHTPVLSWD